MYMKRWCNSKTFFFMQMKTVKQRMCNILFSLIVCISSFFASNIKKRTTIKPQSLKFRFQVCVPLLLIQHQIIIDKPEFSHLLIYSELKSLICLCCIHWCEPGSQHLFLVFKHFPRDCEEWQQAQGHHSTLWLLSRGGTACNQSL